MSDANRTAIRVTREQSPRVPYNAPLFQPLRITSVSLAYSPETTQSNEIDPTRQVNDLPLVGFSSGGDVPMELSIGNTDSVLEGLFLNPWLRTPETLNGASWKFGFGSAAVNRIVSLSATTLTVVENAFLSGPNVGQPASAVSVGQLLYLSGFGGADQVLRATASGATTVTVAGATPVANPPVGARVKVVGFEGVAGDIKATTDGGNALTSTALNFTLMNLIRGQWIYISLKGGSFGFDSFSGFARVNAISANRLDLDRVPAGFATDAGAGKTIRCFFTDSIRNGVKDDYSYTVEEEFGITVGTRYLYHRGQEVNSRVISADTKAIITDTINFMGLDATPMSAARLAGAVSLTPGAGSVLNSSTAVPVFFENGSPVTSPNFVNSFSLSMENNKRAQDAVGVLGSAGIGTGRVSITGNLSTYFGSEVLYNKVLSNEISSVTFGLADPAAMRAEIHDLPKIKYSSGAPDVTGIDTDIYVPLAYQALRDIQGNRDYTYLLSRFEYYL